MKKENKFQADLIREVSELIPGCIVTKNDPNYIQGIPDLSVSFGERVAWLECKKSEQDYYENQQPNQEYYVNLINSQGGFARFIYPENKVEVLNELQRSFGT